VIDRRDDPLRRRRYSFTTSPPASGAVRPLSDADALELGEDDEGAD
jgi:hypothetical protein